MARSGMCRAEFHRIAPTKTTSADALLPRDIAHAPRPLLHLTSGPKSRDAQRRIRLDGLQHRRGLSGPSHLHHRTLIRVERIAETPNHPARDGPRDADSATPTRFASAFSHHFLKRLEARRCVYVSWILTALLNRRVRIHAAERASAPCGCYARPSLYGTLHCSQRALRASIWSVAASLTPRRPFACPSARDFWRACAEGNAMNTIPARVPLCGKRFLQDLRESLMRMWDPTRSPVCAVARSWPARRRAANETYAAPFGAPLARWLHFRSLRWRFSPGTSSARPCGRILSVSARFCLMTLISAPITSLNGHNPTRVYDQYGVLRRFDFLGTYNARALLSFGRVPSSPWPIHGTAASVARILALPGLIFALRWLWFVRSVVQNPAANIYEEYILQAARPNTSLESLRLDLPTSADENTEPTVSAAQVWSAFDFLTELLQTGFQPS
ncbi:hypothetical protein DFH09DRAFT_1094556 [Mycena vulgaris]|nr:hypothetical protein DFH09DRAFT_1094556 [Mycena vulgaris]